MLYMCLTCKIFKEASEYNNSNLNKKHKTCRSCMNNYALVCRRKKGKKEKVIITTETVINRAMEVYGDQCSYDKIEYTGVKSKITITCKKHGDFQVRPDAMSPKGCRHCAFGNAAEISKKSTEEFIRQSKNIYGDKFIYVATIYNGNSNVVIITCKEHGDFKVLPGNHIRGISTSGGCQKCRKFIKKYEMAAIDILNENKVTFEYQWPVKIGKITKFVDFYLPKYKILLEIDERYHDSQKDDDKRREQEILEATDYDYSFLRVPAKKLSLFKTLLKAALGFQ